MKKIGIFEKAMNEGGSLKDYGINSTLFAAYRYCQETGNDNIDFNGVIWDYDIPEIVKALKENGISEFAFLPFEDASKANERLWEKCSGKMKTCIITLFPYRTDYTVKDKYVFSAYARTHDYHKRCEQFFNAVIPRLRNELRHEFEGYADHSPIGEKSAAAMCGLGVIGRNTLLINKKYGSYIFIASILTDMVLESHP